MARTFRSSYILFLFGVFLLLSPTSLSAQEKNTVALKSYLVQLEEKYDVKFSFVDEDLSGLTISAPNFNNLNSILTALEKETKLKIEKLSDRYYTIVKSSLVSICANVFDNYAQNTIPGATVEVLGSEIAIVTDLNGSFSLNDIPRTASLKVRYLGYITRYITIDELADTNTCPNILLDENLEHLDEVVVYKFLTSGLVKQVDASITLNTAELGILPGLIEPDVLQSVQALPGVKSIDETVSDINVRGGTNDQNLILWNGIKLYQSGHFFGLISAFNPYLTDKVTLYKNGTPTQYGDGVSSVISMETKDDIAGSFVGGAGINLISGDVYGQFPINDKVAFQFSARRSITDFLNTPTYNSFTKRAFQDSEIQNQQNQTVDENINRDVTFLFYDFTAKLLYNINENQKLRLNFIGITNDLRYKQTNTNISETAQSFLDQTNVSLGLQLQSQWNSKFSSHLNVYVSKYNLGAENFFNNNQLLIQENTVIENALKFDSTCSISDQLSWGNGYQYIETGITNITNVTQPPFDSKIRGVVRIHAPYSQINYTSFENRLIASGGLRVNYIENLDTFSKWLLEPRLNVNFRLAKNLRAQLLGEFKSQSTNQVIDLEQNFLGVEKRRWILSDENELPITRSKQGSIGLNYEKNSFYVGLEGFYKKVEGISTRTQGFQNQNQFSGEIGEYDVKGVEFLINKRGSNYSTWLSYTYNKNDYNFDSIPPNLFPNNLDVRHAITIAGTYSIKKLKLGLGINYRTGKPFTAPQEGDTALDTTSFPNRINYEEPNSSRLPEYLRVDASANYGFNITRKLKGSASISVLNLTNRKNILNQYYRVSENNEIETVINSSLGITPNISFRVKF